MDTTKKSDLKIIRTRELSELLNVAPSTIWEWRQAGKLPPRVKVGNRYAGWRYRDIDAWLNEQTESEAVSA